MTAVTIDTLLDRLDAAARATNYPPQGLPIWGDYSRREELRLIVADWLLETAPEAQR